MPRLFWICLAGAAGTAARHLVALWSAQRLGAALPYGTLIVNVSGCFLIAVVMHVAMANAWPATLRVALTVGFLGGFTTYSSFNYETTRMLEEGATGAATTERAPHAGGRIRGRLDRPDGGAPADRTMTMRILDGEQALVRIFLGESDLWHHRPLARALLERLRAEGFAGATVIHGVAGFGASSVIHTANLIELSADLPVLIEVVDDQEHVDRLLPILDEMLTGGALVTIEPVRVLRYAHRAKP